MRWHKAAPLRQDPAADEEPAGVREYRARLHDQSAERRERRGDAQGAEVERAAAAEERRTPARGGG